MPKIDDLIGVPFKYGGRGPDSYDCYGLVREIYRRDGINIPDYESPTDGARITAMFALNLHLWTDSLPRPGTVALIRVPGNMHCAYVLDGVNMIHTWEGCGGALIERMDMWQRRIKGFYRYVG